MSWLSVIIDTDFHHAEPLADALINAGALCASIEDADAGMPGETPQFDEPGSVAMPGWTRSRINVLLDPKTNINLLLESCTAAVGLPNHLGYTLETVEEQNWVALTQAQFEPIRISDRLWIVPSWHTPPDPDAIVLVLDPGMAFGTGSHPTTQLCLEWLERVVTPGASLLDYGCGSGILAIAAAQLGATEVFGVDIDPQAVVAARSNAERNGVHISFENSAVDLQGHFDFVVANILSNPLKLLAPAIASHVRPGGKLALSGILETQTEEMIETYAPWIPLAIKGSLDGWVCLSGEKPGGSPVHFDTVEPDLLKNPDNT